ncbi:MAG: hypothetical protein M1831_006990 [Alyxoria varia]|nr:MAG: hypothetical protein M1831_006990 [Alyxoria varia]
MHALTLVKLTFAIAATGLAGAGANADAGPDAASPSPADGSSGIPPSPVPNGPKLHNKMQTAITPAGTPVTYYHRFGCGTDKNHATNHFMRAAHAMYADTFTNSSGLQPHTPLVPPSADKGKAGSKGPEDDKSKVPRDLEDSDYPEGTHGANIDGIGGPRGAMEMAQLVKRAAAAAPAKIGPIDVYAHVVSTKKNAKMVTPAQLQKQVAALNKAYNVNGISFRLAKFEFTVNDKWAVGGDDAADKAMKKALRKGGYNALNLYLQTDLAGGVLGKCTLPTNIGTKPSPATYAVDGCNVAAGTVPGGPIMGFNMGMTAVHETGHWLGLLHTFEGYSCAGNGDFVADTPAEAESTDGCPTSPWKNTCKGHRPGVDPIRNFMDYSVDACYESFSKGQEQRVRQMWGLYRMGK